MSKNENTKIKLQAVIDAIEEATESYTSFYDTKTKETVYLPDAFMTGETDEALLELLENEPDRFLRFPRNTTFMNTALWRHLLTICHRAKSRAN